MAEQKRTARLDQPQEIRAAWLRRPKMFREGSFGVAAEGFARFMGTPQFLVWMTIFCAVWLAWNTFMPEEVQFDPRSLNYTLLTLILSLQASYAAPLLLLAQNRQDDRDRVIAEQDRARDERNLADTEYLTREVASLRMALGETVTRDYLRSELRDLLEEIRSLDDEECESVHRRKKRKTGKRPGVAPSENSHGHEQLSDEERG
ncbi:DUF1003 domain-containing protein [Dermatophilus congolensis]|uniref:Predicted membrane protein n=1 Tax=Dermatophilus congolensis TaxID=1863 RepID=A0A239VR49_9MICO|nr:DUF1003 domain-containing protein [Dermatophilus congolensis]MBO3129689.1 DUF1003 domain-containing protein [Dermatophilus congolensis]MBO3131681.1 DUF1003 domain-containing protein [Dermatophilus congolensis]MBO3134164.1 DUF1003 domain-containing protein [Dermatophilus congolensis]MBO3136397.1 DUF1003 domain-containing protein [Dermatophilus congolensis]MBO3138646.1 DUF1003 domain-containing protein [Dermatophilus congolensis]